MWAGVLPAVFCMNRVKIHKPAFEDRPRYLLQCLIHSTVIFDFIVERT